MAIEGIKVDVNPTVNPTQPSKTFDTEKAIRNIQDLLNDYLQSNFNFLAYLYDSPNISDEMKDILSMQGNIIQDFKRRLESIIPQPQQNSSANSMDQLPDLFE